MSVFDSQKKQTFKTRDNDNNSVSSVQHFRELSAGAGSSIFKVNAEGLFLGADNFTEAPFSVNFAGDCIANSITIDGLDGSDLSDAIDSNGNWINDVINARIDTATKKILSDFDFGSTNYAGGLKAGNITWNTTTGAVTGGSGVVISRAGILGAASGVETFTIDATDGSATFAGTLSAPSGTLGTITAGTITGATIQTATSGYRVKMSTGSVVNFLNGSTNKGSIGADTGDTIVYSSEDNHTFFCDDTYAFQINNSGITIASNNFIGFQSGNKLEDESGYIKCTTAWRVNGACYPDDDNSYTLGASDKRWSNAYWDNGFCDNMTIDVDCYVGDDLDVDGTKNFRIDHPQKPETHWLYHSCVESPERVLLYRGRGKVKNGKATVVLPKYFEEINKDLDYNLTPVGQQMSLWISKEVKNNKFEVSADVDGEFTWVVYGTRNDAYCRNRPFVEEKKKEVVGYSKPELFGKDKKEGLRYKRNKKAKIEEDKILDKLELNK